jgi:membrane dipeptidase
MVPDSHSPALALYPVFDGHNDLPWAIRQKFGSDVAAAGLGVGQPRLQTDVPRLRSGGVAAQFWSVFVPSTMEPAEAVVATLEQIDCVHRIVDLFPDDFALVQSADEVRAARASGRIASLMGVEGGHCIDSSLGVLRSLRRAGVGYLTLTHNDNTPWAQSSSGEPVDFGLTDFGRSVVREMNRIGMIVDLSHVAERTMHDALDVAEAPVLFSHSSCRAITDHPRNVPDGVLSRLPDNGGVVMLTFVPFFVSQACADYEWLADNVRARVGLRVGFHHEDIDDDPEAVGEFERWQAKNPQPVATIGDVVRHIEHARDLIGVRHLGLGSDFDGIEVVPHGLDDVACYPHLFASLAERGWSPDELRGLAFDNVLRVVDETEEYARSQQSSSSQPGPETSEPETLG